MDICNTAQFSATMNNTTRNINGHAFGKSIYELPRGVYPGAQWQSQRARLGSVFIVLTKKFSNNLNSQQQ